MKKSILVLCVIFCLLQAGFAQRDTIWLAPCLQYSFKSDTWKMRYDYYRGTFYTATSNEQIEMTPISWPFAVSTDSLLALEINEDRKDPANNFMLNGCHVSGGEYTPDPNHSEVKRRYYTIFKAKGHYCDMINITSPPDMAKEMEAIMKQVTTSLDVLSPTQMDSVDGLPLSGESFFPMVNKRLAAMKKLYAIEDDKDHGLDSLLLPGIRLELAKKINYKYTHQRFYTIDEQLRLGRYPFGKYLDLYLLGEEDPEEKMWSGFDGGVHGEYGTGFALAADSFLRTMYTIPRTSKIEWANEAKPDPDGGKGYVVEAAATNEADDSITEFLRDPLCVLRVVCG